jgi:hypothetical protein
LINIPSELTKKFLPKIISISGENLSNLFKYQSNYVIEISLIMDIDQIYLKIFTIEFKYEGKTNVESFFGGQRYFSFQMEEIHLNTFDHFKG